MSVLTSPTALKRSGGLARTRAFGPPLLAVLIAATLLPLEASFYLGTFRLTVERLVLITVSPVVILSFFSNVRRFVASDLLVVVTAFWMILSNGVVQGFDQAAKSTGVLALEFCLPYFIARTSTKTQADVIGSTRFLCLAVSIVGILAVIDPIANRYVIHEWFSNLTGIVPNLIPDYRLGFLRAAGSLEHPILLGTNCAIAILLSTALVVKERWFTRAGSLIGLLSSFSSGPMGALLLGLTLIAYDKVLGRLRGRWGMLSSAAVLAAGALFLIANDPIGRFLSTFTFEAGSAYYRLLIWHYGSLNVARSPIFGIGLGAPWYREDWMTTSVDTFWLATAMTYGIPGLMLTAISWLSPFMRRIREEPNTVLHKLKFTLNVVMLSIVYIGFTVDFWGPTFVMISIIVGLRASLNVAEATDVSDPHGGAQNIKRSPV